VALFLLLGQFGAALRLGQWMLDLSPFTHIPKIPGGDFTVTPLLWLTALAMALTVGGLAGLRRRDLG
jgi:ABC-2 type transport system permease protein